MLRFHLDEHIDHGVSRALAARGIDATTTTDAGLLGADDDAHIAFARSGGRVIVTNDADFLRVASEDSSHHGVAFCAPGSRTLGEPFVRDPSQHLHATKAPEDILLESEWPSTSDVWRMLEVLQRSSASQRKVRLFNTAVCRRYWSYLPDASRKVLLESELLADDKGARA